jgi:hypothetical protein
MRGMSSADRNAERYRFAPRRFLSKTPDHDLPARLLALSRRSRHLTAAFHSLATTARFRATIARSTILACRFNVMPDGHRNRSICYSSSRTGLLSGPVGIKVAYPFSDFASGTSGLAPASPPPPGLRPWGIIGFGRLSSEKPTFRYRPIVLRSPRPSINSFGCGSKFQTRYGTGGQLSHADIGRLIGCQLPDAILHGKRSLRPRSRAVQHLPVAGLLSEAFQLASTGGCATGLRTRSRHVYVFLSASSPLSAGSAAAFDSAFARCHGSRLLTLRLPFVHRSAVPFLTPPTSRKVFTGPAQTPRPSRFELSLCPAFRRISCG